MGTHQLLVLLALCSTAVLMCGKYTLWGIARFRETEALPVLELEENKASMAMWMTPKFIAFPQFINNPPTSNSDWDYSGKIYF